VVALLQDLSAPLREHVEQEEDVFPGVTEAIGCSGHSNSIVDKRDMAEVGRFTAPPTC